MSRRTRPTAASTIHIPRQRGGRREPVILVVSSEPSPTLTSRAALAVGRWAWKHRLSWAPTAVATALLVVTGAVHLIEPRTAWFLAALALAPAGVWAWGMLRRRPASRQAALWRAALAAFATAVAAWFALAVWFAPTRPALFTAWTVLTLAAQVAWLVARRLTLVSEKESA
ncbi:hypothetical protein OG311_14325 [Streptomyces sp. NBC_01343]|uniref:hypothetical protein n=1 Tax=Streptomyces sp. NBC_01343 TaxID=2903832 RepID=UPI002E10003D|nr:hypothetical protein OG311_14325 [Streptomyces sp. NBC_01343]